MADFKIIETQEQLDAILGERLTRERNKLEEKFKNYISPDQLNDKLKDLTDQIAGLNSQLEDAGNKSKEFEKSIAERDALIKKHETASVKSRIAHEVGLSYDAIGFLQGDDEESIRQSAETLKGLVGNKIAPPLKQPELPREDGVMAAFKKLNPNIKI